MKTILSLIALLIMTSCGNPHISSVSGGLEVTNPPLSPVTSPACKAKTIKGLQFVSDSASYMEFVKCKNLIKEDFNSFEDSYIYEVSNRKIESFSYSVVHKALNPEGMMNDDNFELRIDGGVLDFPQAFKGSRDLLYWNFSSPLSHWGSKIVNLGAEATLTLYDCEGKIIGETEVSQEFIGLATEFRNVCGISLEGHDSDFGIDEFTYAE